MKFFKNIFTFFLLLVCIALGAQTSQAHKVRIFAWAEGNTIHGETSFSGSRKPKNAEIQVLDQANQEVLLTTKTDGQGKFSFTVPPKAAAQHLDLLLVVNSGEGHRGQWPLPAAEYLADQAGQAETPKTSLPAAGKKRPDTVNISPLTMVQAPVPTDEETLRKIIDRELEKKLAPIKEMLARNSEHKVTLRDILGGIGYILGLAGMAAWAGSRKRGGENKS
jgi:nickel transport protein